MGGLSLRPTSRAAPLSVWSSPSNLSSWQGDTIWYSHLALGADGTQAAFWIVESGQNLGELWARLRLPNQNWESEQKISDIKYKDLYTLHWSSGIAPDGTAWVVWAGFDPNIATGKKVLVYAAHHPPGGSWLIECLTPAPMNDVGNGFLKFP